MTLRINRREALAIGAAGLGGVGASCNRSDAPSQPRSALVSITRAASYGQELYDTIRRILVEHKLDVRGKKVVLKPNLVEFDATTAINTHPLVVHAALEGFRALGAADVRIAEGPGHRRITLDLAEAAGYFSTIPAFERLFTDLNLDDVTEVHIPRPVSKLKSLYLPNTVLGCDLLVSLAKMKTHHWVGATLSMKNFFGLVPGAIYDCIADLQQLVPRTFSIVDGIIGMEGNGPIQGVPKPARVIVAGANLPAVDTTCCRIMRLDPGQMDYLAAVNWRPGSPIVQIGESVEHVATAFELLPSLRRFRST
jgi:uncharacterized protein (DUF362 family)